VLGQNPGSRMLNKHSTILYPQHLRIPIFQFRFYSFPKSHWKKHAWSGRGPFLKLKFQVSQFGNYTVLWDFKIISTQRRTFPLLATSFENSILGC
jgi:hypothetical protein